MAQVQHWLQPTSHSFASQYDDAMDTDEQILNDVASLRASTWKASAVQPFEDTNLHGTGIQTFIVLDSNVLISYLHLIKEVMATISRQSLKMALCLPNVVVAELNYLKERNASPNTRALAQEANIWLLAQVRSRNGLLRGQQKSESLEQAQDVRRVNDDQIVDYCQYLLSTAQAGNATVCLLSNDQNCCLKAELQGIMTISPKQRVNAGTVISTIVQKAGGSSVSGHASLPVTLSNHTGPSKLSQGVNTPYYSTYVPVNQAGLSIEGVMDLDDDEHIASPVTPHPLTQLHAQLIEHLSETLPHFAYDAALQEQARRGSGKQTVPQSSKPKPSALYTSIHAPKDVEREQSLRAFVMPTQGQVQSWKPLDCIHFALEFPPVPDKVASNTNRKARRPPSIAKLKLFLLAHDQPGGRRGRDWSIGDWMLSLEELNQVGECLGWNSVCECVVICRSQLSQSGLQI